jgi:hypothetical protein
VDPFDPLLLNPELEEEGERIKRIAEREEQQRLHATYRDDALDALATRMRVKLSATAGPHCRNGTSFPQSILADGYPQRVFV